MFEIIKATVLIAAILGTANVIGMIVYYLSTNEMEG